jgi:hypothetical protein
MRRRFWEHLRTCFELDLSLTRLLLLRWAPAAEPFFSAPALAVLRWLDRRQYGIRA